MKTLLIAALLLTAELAPLRAQTEATKTSLQSADADVQAAQARLHAERKTYVHAVQTSGKDSPQALAAKGRVDTARGSWHEKMAQRQTLRHQARRDMAHHRSHHP